MEQKEKGQDKDFKYFVRIANTDLDGKKSIGLALRKIKGVGIRLANVVCALSGVDRTKKAGTLDDSEIKKLNDVVSDPLKYNAPVWMVNRRKDITDGTDKHLITSDLIFTKENDIKSMKKMKSYKGVRHAVGLTVRGQRTKANFRRNKGKLSLGVKKKGAK